MTRTHLTSALSVKIGLALLLTVAADFLFFEQPLGISTLMFGCLLVIAIVAVHPAAFAKRLHPATMVVAAGALLPLFENISCLSITVAIFGLSAFALSISGHIQFKPAKVLDKVAGFLLASPLRLPVDILRLRKAVTRQNRASGQFGGIVIWMMPIVLGAVFLMLFGIANPVIDYWISRIDPWILLDLLDIWRIAFWLIFVALVWAFLRPRLPRWLRRAHSARPIINIAHGSNTKAAVALQQMVFGKAAILRALLLFNVMFAVQTVLDGSYLWAGVALPDGLSYASYAHRGAYPLIVTALLAAVFVLVAMQPGSATAADRPIRKLVYLWIAQNVVLVISSILRLDLYIGIYSLTYWRVAAFVWMGLVAVGLVLIMARIMLRQSNEWLLGANLLTLSATLYACCFINFAAMIANYNATHSREVNGGGLGLDLGYLRSLGPAAIPAMDVLLAKAARADPGVDQTILAGRASEKNEFLVRRQNWRSWTFRDWRLARYFDGFPEPARPDIPASGP